MRKTEEDQGAKLVRAMTGVLLGGGLALVVCLVFLGVIALYRIGCMPVQSLASILAHTDRDVWIFLVELVEELAVHIGCSAIPSIVMVV